MSTAPPGSGCDTWAVHDGKITIEPEQVAALVGDQLPELAEESVVEVPVAGTVNSIYRIGDHYAARFPLQHDDSDLVRARLGREFASAAEFHNASPFASPRPVLLGHPGHGYPLPWTTQTWIPGMVATPTSDEHSFLLAEDLARLIENLWDVDTNGRSFGSAGRGGRLHDHDEWVEGCIRNNAPEFGEVAMRNMWNRFRELPRQDPDLMCHTDLIPPNLLVDDGRIRGVLDTGGFQAADPAVDLVCAWHLLSRSPRKHLRSLLKCDDLAMGTRQSMGVPAGRRAALVLQGNKPNHGRARKNHSPAAPHRRLSTASEAGSTQPGQVRCRLTRVHSDLGLSSHCVKAAMIS